MLLHFRKKICWMALILLGLPVSCSESNYKEQNDTKILFKNKDKQKGSNNMSLNISKSGYDITQSTDKELAIFK